MNTFTFKLQPPIVGYWILPGSTPEYGTYFGMTGKPSWLRRKAMWLVLGFKWRDA